MNKHLHDMDEIFNSAYKQFGEDPSPDVWEHINAGLDKREASLSKRKLRTWKRVSLLSWLLIGGFVLFQITKVVTGQGSMQETATRNSGSKASARGQKVAAETRKHIQNSHYNPIAHKSGDVAGENAGMDAKNDVSGVVHNQSTIGGILHVKGKDLFRATVVSTKNTIEGQQLTPTVPFLSPQPDEQAAIGYPTASLKNDIPSFKTINTNHIGMQTRRIGEPTFLNIVSYSNELANPHKAKLANPFSPEPRWAVSAFFSSDHPGYRLDKDGPTLARIKQHEEHQTSYSGGVMVSRRLTHRLSLQTGLLYSDIGIAISPEQIYASVNSDGHVLYKYVVSSGYAYIKPKFAPAPSPGDSLTAEDSQHSLQYLVVPVLGRYRLIDHHKFIITSGVGIAGNFLTSATIEAEVAESFNREHVSIRRLEGIRSFNVSVMGDLTMEYEATKKLSISLRPFFSYALSPITNNNDVETFPYNLGVGAGITYRF